MKLWVKAALAVGLAAIASHPALAQTPTGAAAAAASPIPAAKLSV